MDTTARIVKDSESGLYIVCIFEDYRTYIRKYPAAITITDAIEEFKNSSRVLYNIGL